MVKCVVCKEKVEQTFLQKVLGTYVRDAKGKKQLVCQSCQKLHSMDELREKL